MHWHFSGWGQERDCDVGCWLPVLLLGFDWVPGETVDPSSQDPTLSPICKQNPGSAGPTPEPGPPSCAQKVYLINQKPMTRAGWGRLIFFCFMLLGVGLLQSGRAEESGVLVERGQAALVLIDYIMLWIRNHDGGGILPFTTASAKRGLFILLLGK